MSCWCSDVGFLQFSASDVLPADLDKDEIRKQLQDAEEEHLQIERGGGSVDEVSIEKCNRSFIEEFYPNLVEKTYSFPLVFQPKFPSESSADMKTQLGKEDGRVGNREGDEAEQKVFQTLLAMFKLHKIASFTISGYTWMEFLPDKITSVLEKIPSKEMFQGGECDLLVLLPGKGVLDIEVKAKKKTKGLKKVIVKCFNQCRKASRFVAFSTLDINPENELSFVKVACLPDISRHDIKSMTCQKCSTFFITEEDLKSPSTLFNWFKQILNLYRDCQLDQKVYEHMVARFIGPLSRVKVKLLPEVINDTHRDLQEYGSHQQIKAKWVQLNKEQSDIVFTNPGHLWITGAPGSGKTVLALWKVQVMLRSVTNGNHVIYLIPGHRDMLLIENTKMLLGSHLTESKKGTVLKIKSIEDVFVEKSDWYGLKGLLDVIERLTSRHVDSQVSIILDEFSYFKRDSSDKLNICNENLRNVWIIQNFSCKITPYISLLEPLRFTKIELQRIMRISDSNVKLLNRWLKGGFQVGHCVQGLHPILHKMECICKMLNSEDRQICIPFLIRRLTEEVVTSLRTLPNKKVEIDISEDVVVITERHVEVKKLLSQRCLEVTVRPALYFTGCEKKIVIVDIRNVGGSGNYENNLLEALTRATGRLVLLDVFCENDRQIQQDVNFNKLVGCINKIPNTVIEREICVRFNKTELSVLKRDINLGLFRDEQDIQENMASAVTGKVLQETISPLNEKIDKLQDDVSAIKQILQRMETQI